MLVSLPGNRPDPRAQHGRVNACLDTGGCSDEFTHPLRAAHATRTPGAGLTVCVSHSVWESRTQSHRIQRKPPPLLSLSSPALSPLPSRTAARRRTSIPRAHTPRGHSPKVPTLSPRPSPPNMPLIAAPAHRLPRHAAFLFSPPPSRGSPSKFRSRRSSKMRTRMCSEKSVGVYDFRKETTQGAGEDTWGRCERGTRARVLLRASACCAFSRPGRLCLG